MHVPDGFVSAPVATVGCIVAAGCIAYAVKATNEKMGEKQVPLMGVLAAFIVAGFIGYYVYRGGVFLFGRHKRGALVSGGIAAWLSVVAASVACAFELAISGTAPLGVVL